MAIAFITADSETKEQVAKVLGIHDYGHTAACQIRLLDTIDELFKFTPDQIADSHCDQNIDIEKAIGLLPLAEYTISTKPQFTRICVRPTCTCDLANTDQSDIVFTISSKTVESRTLG